MCTEKDMSKKSMKNEMVHCREDGNKDKIYIRVDMNEVIATGHVMRCLSIADAAREQGKEVVFIVADEKPVELLRGRGYEPVVLGTNWNCMDEEAEIICSVIKSNKIKKILVDSYQVTEIFYLDDVDAFEYPVSNVICYANYYSVLSYGKYKRNTKFYLGTSYMPVRKVFQNCKAKEIKEGIEHIMILSGGSDPYHMIENITDLFKENEKVQVDVICGAFYPGFESLKEKFKEFQHLHFYQNVSNLDEFMEKADLAISAGGTTLYELCAKGTPAISYSFADNQLNNVNQFDTDGLISYAGDVSSDEVYKKIYDLYEEYRNPDLRKERSKRMQKVMDGKGAARIAELL